MNPCTREEFQAWRNGYPVNRLRVTDHNEGGDDVRRYTDVALGVLVAEVRKPRAGERSWAHAGVPDGPVPRHTLSCGSVADAGGFVWFGGERGHLHGDGTVEFARCRRRAADCHAAARFTTADRVRVTAGDRVFSPPERTKAARCFESAVGESGAATFDVDGKPAVLHVSRCYSTEAAARSRPVGERVRALAAAAGRAGAPPGTRAARRRLPEPAPMKPRRVARDPATGRLVEVRP